MSQQTNIELDRRRRSDRIALQALTSRPPIRPADLAAFSFYRRKTCTSFMTNLCSKSEMIKPPFKACEFIADHWIENADGQTVVSVDAAITGPEARKLAEFVAKAMNYLAEKQEQLRKVAPLGACGGRPRLYKPREPIEPPKQRGRPRRVKKPNGG